MPAKNKIVIITGGASGVGLATTKAFINENATVVVLDLKKPEQGEFIRTDLSDPDSIKKSFEKIKNDYQTIDALINNAGILQYGNVVDTALEDWHKTFAININAAFLCAKYAIPLMQKGVVINVGSAQAFVCQHNVAAYATSKTAMLGLTRSIAVDFAPDIRCVAVCPGTIDTPMLQWAIDQSDKPEAVLNDCEEMHLPKRIGKPEEVADLICYLVSDKAGFITGQSFRIDGGTGVLLAGTPETY